MIDDTKQGNTPFYNWLASAPGQQAINDLCATDIPIATAEMALFHAWIGSQEAAKALVAERDALQTALAEARAERDALRALLPGLRLSHPNNSSEASVRNPAHLPQMHDRHYRALLDLRMASDPWPDAAFMEDVDALLDGEARARGFDNWIDAFHSFEVLPEPPADYLHQQEP